MDAGRRTQAIVLNESAAFSPNKAINHRNLTKNHLGGVVFGCTNSTINECLFKQVFGLPAQHFPYVKNIDPGLPLFLFNYSDRKLHGIFEAASSGKMNINPYAWTTDGTERTVFPAQVQIHIRLRCQPLPEEQFKPIIIDNYYSQNHFWFELDHAQTSKLMSLLSCRAIASSTVPPRNATQWRTLFQAPPSHDRKEEGDGIKPPAFEVEIPHSSKSSKSNGSSSSDIATCLDSNIHPLENCLDKQVVEKEEDLIYMKLKELALSRERSDLPLSDVEDSAVTGQEAFSEAARTNSEEKNEESLVSSCDYPSIIAQLIQEIEELQVFKIEQIHKMGCLEQKLVEADIEIQQLNQRCIALESLSQPSVACVDETTMESLDLEPDLDELIFLVGGYDGGTWLSALDSYSPTHDVIKTLNPMNSIRSYAAVASLNDEFYVFGGGNGCLWYDTVESYDPANNQWTLRPSLNVKKGSLGGATLNNKIFALGGGNGVESFADVEMLDLDVGRWIFTRSMLEKRFALAAAELNGALYAVGGYDGNDYLKSVERFDPREHSWTRIESMNTKRGCPSMVVLNEKLYVIGGFDGSAMVPSIEIYDPRLGSWEMGEPIYQSRGYSSAAVLKDSIYILGGLKSDESIAEEVERYEEGKGWQVTNLKAIGKRSFFSVFVA
ncbi:uncharacterized protein LOC130795021 [Actinidia eriantha]|uniref:uncharacterized protein LOC130795021 n=1 Tax=Actinidia eriantha TaxID=165200 RepID=UPI00258E6914|nr:uncharacterized protein LOC130795021 [Actinidia eriantha]